MRNIHMEYRPERGEVLIQLETRVQAWPSMELTIEEAEHLRERLNLLHTQIEAKRRREREARLTETVQLPDGSKAAGQGSVRMRGEP